jgi:hypothetical protein
MRRHDPPIGSKAWHPAVFCLGALACMPAALAQEAPKAPGGIYSCVDAKGRFLRQDRPIPECADREQRILNADGSVKGVHPPSLTADERAEREARERRLAEEKAAIADAGRRDRGLIKRYPNEASHQRAREVSLDTTRQAIRATEQRLRELAAERKPLLNEAEFYQGRQLPPKLKQQLDANDAAAEAQRAASANQEAELGRVTRSFDAELDRLRKLWAGATPGSMGPLVVPPAPAAPTPHAASGAARKTP